MKDNVSIIILAGGKGTRMESDAPKALTLLDGKPFLSHILETIKSSFGEAIKPVIVVGYKKEEVIKTIGEDYTYAVQEEQLGTGHAVKITEEYLQDKTGSVVILYADHPMISGETIKALVEKQQETKSPIVMATTIVPHFEDWYHTFIGWGRFKRNSMDDITAIIEYKDADDQEKAICEVNPGYSVFDKAWLFEHLQKLSNENAQKEYYLTGLVQFAFDEGYVIPSVTIPPEEAIGANSLKELEILEQIYNKKNKS